MKTYNNPEGTTVITDDLLEVLTVQSKRYKWFMEQVNEYLGSYLELDLTRYEESLDGLKSFFSNIDKEIEEVL